MMEIHHLVLVGFGILVITGISMNFYYYQDNIVPVNLSIDHLNGIISSNELNSIKMHITGVHQNMAQIMNSLPQTYDVNGNVSKNPVWFYGTESTNLVRIQSDLNLMQTMVDKFSYVPQDSSAYHNAMMDLKNRSVMLRENISDARGFLYASPTNVLFTVIWIFGIAGLIKTWTRNQL